MSSKAIAQSGKNKIVDTKALFEGIKTEDQTLNEAISHQRHTYSQQLEAYLRTHTSGGLNIRVGKGLGPSRLSESLFVLLWHRRPQGVLSARA